MVDMVDEGYLAARQQAELKVVARKYKGLLRVWVERADMLGLMETATFDSMRLQEVRNELVELNGGYAPNLVRLLRDDK